MGVKSTIKLTRRDAEESTINKILDEYRRLVIENVVKNMTDKEIEDYLEIGREFYNYMIVEEE